MSTHYDTLGVQPGATAKEIRKAYLRRARALHPDRQQGRSPADARRAEEAMRQVNVAWNCLSNEEKRSAYDQRISPRRDATRTSQPRPAQATRPAAQRQSGQQRATSQSQAKKSGQPRQASSQRQPHRTDTHRHSIDDEPGDGSVSVLASLPVLIILGIALGLLIITAFGNQGDTSDNRERVPELDSQMFESNCFTFMVDGGLQQESCATGRADAEVVAVVPDPGNCPADTESVTQGDTVLCFVRLVPGSSVQAN